jgi:hypothetical protein
MSKGNPMLPPVRVHPSMLEKVEKRALSLGYITPAGKANISEYIRSLITKDLDSHLLIIDGNESNYDVK